MKMSNQILLKIKANIVQLLYQKTDTWPIIGIFYTPPVCVIPDAKNDCFWQIYERCVTWQYMCTNLFCCLVVSNFLLTCHNWSWGAIMPSIWLWAIVPGLYKTWLVFLRTASIVWYLLCFPVVLHTSQR